MAGSKELDPRLPGGSRLIVFAAADMREAAAAARALKALLAMTDREGEVERHHLSRALETAVVVFMSRHFVLAHCKRRIVAADTPIPRDERALPLWPAGRERLPHPRENVVLESSRRGAPPGRSAQSTRPRRTAYSVTRSAEAAAGFRRPFHASVGMRPTRRKRLFPSGRNTSISPSSRSSPVVSVTTTPCVTSTVFVPGAGRVPRRRRAAAICARQSACAARRSCSGAPARPCRGRTRAVRSRASGRSGW